jgi:hypothetical protein
MSCIEVRIADPQQKSITPYFSQSAMYVPWCCMVVQDDCSQGGTGNGVGVR